MSEEHPAVPTETPAVAAPEPAAGAAAVPEPVAAPAETAPPAEAPVAEPATPTLGEPQIKPHTDEAGLLQATPPEEAKPAPEGEAKAAEPAAPEATAYEFTIPENFEVPAERLDEVRAIMTEANVPKEQAEKLWGMHTAAMEEFANRALQAQHDAFAEYRRGERLKIAADPEVGGAGFETSKATAIRMLNLIARDPGGDAAKTATNHAEMNEWLSVSGATDSYALFKALVRLSHMLDESQGGPPPQPRPPSAREQQGRPPGGGSRIAYTHSRGGARN
jgi:hypothetical protein